MYEYECITKIVGTCTTHKVTRYILQGCLKVRTAWRLLRADEVTEHLITHRSASSLVHAPDPVVETTTIFAL